MDRMKFDESNRGGGCWPFFFFFFFFAGHSRYPIGVLNLVDDAEREGFNFVSIFNHFSFARSLLFFRDVA